MKNTRNEKGQFVSGHSDKRKGKTLEEIYGVELARKIKDKMSAAKKGKTWKEIWGIDGAKKRLELSKKFVGKNATNWKGGRKVERGYVHLYMPNHLSANHKGCVTEHRHVAEKALGRRLRLNEVIHHINGIRSDNRNCNLLICSRGLHSHIEKKMVRLYQKEHFTMGEL